MKFSLSFALACLMATAALAQSPPPPMITWIMPTSGPTAGGTPVIIFGAHFDLPAGYACFAPCPTTVTFGGIEVVPDQVTDTRIDVKTPAHAEGLVDMLIKTGDGRSLPIPYAFRYVADPEAAYETILLPIYTDVSVPGANGSLWKTDFWLRNNGRNEVTLAPWVCPADGGCPAVFPLTHVLKPGETLHNLPAPFVLPGPNPARLLYATRAEAAALSGNLRFSDSSRRAVNGGTEVPIVREQELRTGTVALHNIPLDSHYRVMLRVYDVALAESRFQVNFYPEDAGMSQPAISTIELTAKGTDSGPFRLHPSWAQYGSLTDLLNLPTIMPPQLRAEIVPLTPGAKFWAFISLTNNDTQHVTVITPQ